MCTVSRPSPAKTQQALLLSTDTSLCLSGRALLGTWGRLVSWPRQSEVRPSDTPPTAVVAVARLASVTQRQSPPGSGALGLPSAQLHTPWRGYFRASALRVMVQQRV